jgi:hypothetical protein
MRICWRKARAPPTLNWSIWSRRRDQGRATWRKSISPSCGGTGPSDRDLRRACRRGAWQVGPRRARDGGFSAMRRNARHRTSREPTPVARLPAEATALLFPARRKWSLQLLQDQALIRAAREDLLDDVGRQHCQSQDPANVALRDILGVADLADGGVDALVQQSLPTPRPCPRLYQCAIGLRFRTARFRCGEGLRCASRPPRRWRSERFRLPGRSRSNILSLVARELRGAER